ncbi:hypothetical protein DUNSADRAFT_6825 [Dunaliella salina]|uniref:Uncharacterized protein n=1 Tax=Dunaliella salina TaxID=3046 RepID=A0ABQ7GMK3_DUNSA|nr:hypothetical protein DUNSADRAFT_6825 [Dunaliella salina]|eukprot:KAF5835838.1 hypothetical protein DUNSADRAFT_6825 [Dunaliella salina]
MATLVHAVDYSKEAVRQQQEAHKHIPQLVYMEADVRRLTANDSLKPSSFVGVVDKGTMDALLHIIRSLLVVKRLQPLGESLFLVVNKCDLPLFFQTGSVEGGTLIPELAGMGMTSANIISNDAQSATEWMGEMPDLQLAIRQVGSQLPILAMSAPAFTVLPGYNMQRIVEHSFIRNRDVIATRVWGPSDVAVATYPPASPHKKGSPASTGLLSASMDRDMMLQSGMHHSNGSFSTSNGAGGNAQPVVALAHAADTTVMPPLRSIELGVSPYLGDVIAEPILLLKATWMTFFHDNCRPGGSNFLQQGPVEHLSNEFNKLYFGRDVMQQDGEVKRVPGLSDFKLPSTFYMTQYRRQAADAMR